MSRHADALLLSSRCFPEPLYCCTGRILDRRLEELGGKRFAPRADINAEDWPAINSWLQRAMTELQKLSLKPHEIPPGMRAEAFQGNAQTMRHDCPQKRITMISGAGCCSFTAVDQPAVLKSLRIAKPDQMRLHSQGEMGLATVVQSVPSALNGCSVPAEVVLLSFR